MDALDIFSNLMGEIDLFKHWSTSRLIARARVGEGCLINNFICSRDPSKVQFIPLPRPINFSFSNSYQSCTPPPPPPKKKRKRKNLLLTFFFTQSTVLLQKIKVFFYCLSGNRSKHSVKSDPHQCLLDQSKTNATSGETPLF